MIGRKVKGFTLIELMIVVALVGIIAGIAAVKFVDLMVRAREASIKGNLAGVRSAIRIYYTDNDGLHPSTGSLVTTLTTDGRYLGVIPDDVLAQPHAHLNGRGVLDSGGPVDDGASSSQNLWWYSGSGRGRFAVNCTHADSRGTVWSTF